MTSEREELARWADSFRDMLQHLGVRMPSDIEALERIAAVLREPVGEPDLDTLGEWHTVAQECSAKLAELKRWIGNAMRDAVAQPASAEPADRLDRVLRVSQAGTAGSASVITEAAPAGGQPQPATPPPTDPSYRYPQTLIVLKDALAAATKENDALRAEVEHQTRSADATHKLLLQMQDRALKAEAEVERMRDVAQRHGREADTMRAEISDALDVLGVAGVDAPMTLGECARAVVEERDALRAEVERLRMQLTACGVIAMADTPESAAQAREIHPDYRSASCDDVARSVWSASTREQAADDIRADRLRVLDAAIRAAERVMRIRGCDCRDAMRDLRREIEQP